jgi:hypothetical protein
MSRLFLAAASRDVYGPCFFKVEWEGKGVPCGMEREGRKVCGDWDWGQGPCMTPYVPMVGACFLLDALPKCMHMAAFSPATTAHAGAAEDRTRIESPADY